MQGAILSTSQHILLSNGKMLLTIKQPQIRVNKFILATATSHGVVLIRNVVCNGIITLGSNDICHYFYLPQ